LKIVSDASPLIFLAKSGLILKALEGNTIFIPPSVQEEVSNGKFTDAHLIKTLVKGGKILVRDPAVKDDYILLGVGESEAINLAIELKPDFLLIDEAKGRRIARNLGLATLGTLGMLNQLLKRGKITKSDAFVAIHKLKESKYYLHPSILEAFIEKIKNYEEK